MPETALPAQLTFGSTALRVVRGPATPPPADAPAVLAEHGDALFDLARAISRDERLPLAQRVFCARVADEAASWRGVDDQRLAG